MVHRIFNAVINSGIQLVSVQQPGKQNQETQADALFLSGQFTEAALIYRQILQRDTGRLDIRVRLGRLALLAHKPKSAITYFASALNNGLRSRHNWEMLADAYLANGEPGSAALCYERAGRNGLAGTLAVMASREPCRVVSTADACEFDWLPEVQLPLIEAELNGIRLNLLVDTAAGDLVLDEKVAIAAGIPHGGQEVRHFAGGLPAMVTYGHVESLVMGNFTVHDILTQILDLQSKLTSYAPAAPIHGILGVSILSRFITVLDFAQRRLRLHATVPAAKSSPVEKQLNEVPFWLADNHFIIVQAEIPNTAAAMWVIDTGMAGAGFAISLTAVQAAGLVPLSADQETGIGGGGSIEGQRVILPSLKLGSHDRPHVEGIALGTFPLKDRFGFATAGLLACDYFQGSVLSLDFSRMTLNLD